MKIVALLVFFGMLQVCVDGFVDMLPTPGRHGWLKKQEKATTSQDWDDTWDCSKCENKNYSWTSICGKCGRSK